MEYQYIIFINKVFDLIFTGIGLIFLKIFYLYLDIEDYIEAIEDICLK
jgi:hypothetical protein